MNRVIIVGHEVPGAIAGRHGFWAVAGGDSATALALSRDLGPDAWLVDVAADTVLQFTEGRQRAPVDSPAVAFLGRLGLYPGWQTGDDWPPRLREMPASLTIVHEFGQALGPYARHRISMSPDGRFRLDAWQIDGSLAWEGICQPTMVTRLCNILADCDFPRLPDHPIQPGPSFREISAEVGGRSASALMARFPLETIPPFSLLATIFDSVCAQARDVPVRGLVNRLDRVVQASHRVEVRS